MDAFPFSFPLLTKKPRFRGAFYLSGFFVGSTVYPSSNGLRRPFSHVLAVVRHSLRRSPCRDSVSRRRLSGGFSTFPRFDQERRRLYLYRSCSILLADFGNAVKVRTFPHEDDRFVVVVFKKFFEFANGQRASFFFRVSPIIGCTFKNDKFHGRFPFGGLSTPFCRLRLIRS